MTWMVIRLVLSLAFVAAVLLFAARIAKKKGLGQATGVIEVVSRQRMGRASSVSVLRVAGRVLVVGSTEEQVTLLAELEDEELQTALAAQPRPQAVTADGETRELPARVPAMARTSSGPLAGSVLDRSTWTTAVQELRDRTVRRS
ncbi:FliO/MopB family protein [Modestobacter roseus]|uniref:Flagellar protein FliO/FliZ n=1 Tax=Modestobacter roseus TaxID=1181884 RepID=A0A562IKW8_9ACTN|nr:flagellar biosynthetic protein FliO [Modestobacter roseus]MQA34534.1 flagellar protein flio [Modestobacter roseus]TWH71590.1 flagellar protein FliO/FliZ [Modestobacter roseus]